MSNLDEILTTLLYQSTQGEYFADIAHAKQAIIEWAISQLPEKRDVSSYEAAQRAENLSVYYENCGFNTAIDQATNNLKEGIK